MSSAIEVNKKLKLNIGVCKRLIKEFESYKKEAENQERKIQKMRDESKDPYGIYYYDYHYLQLLLS